MQENVYRNKAHNACNRKSYILKPAGVDLCSARWQPPSVPSVRFLSEAVWHEIPLASGPRRMRQVFRTIGIRASIVNNMAARSCQSSLLDLALTKPMHNESVH